MTISSIYPNIFASETSAEKSTSKTTPCDVLEDLQQMSLLELDQPSKRNQQIPLTYPSIDPADEFEDIPLTTNNVAYNSFKKTSILAQKNSLLAVAKDIGLVSIRIISIGIVIITLPINAAGIAAWCLGISLKQNTDSAHLDLKKVFASKTLIYVGATIALPTVLALFAFGKGKEIHESLKTE